jgi:hypothetical protein
MPLDATNNNVRAALMQDIDPDDNFFNAIHSSLDQNQQSDYYTIDRYNSNFRNFPNSLTLLNCNVCSLNANGGHFFSMLKSLCKLPEIFSICETWLSETSIDTASLSGYSSHHTVRPVGRGGGVSVFVDDGFVSHRLDALCHCDATIESCVVKIIHGDVDIFVVALYRPHTDTIQNFSLRLIELLSSGCMANGRIVVMGDFNINLLAQDSPHVDAFINDLQSLSFIPVITKPTRFPPHGSNISPTALDHIWTNTLQPYSSGIIITDISDHCPNFIHLPCALKNSDKIKIYFRSHNPVNMNCFICELSLINWESVLTGDIHNQVVIFNNTVNRLYCRCFPLKTKYISIKRLHKPWLSSALLKAIKIKSQNYKLLKLNLISKAFNNEYKNRLNSDIRTAKITYFRNAFTNCRSDIKKTWKVIRSALGQGGKNKNIKGLLVNGVDVFGEAEMSEIFNNYFSNIGSDLDADIPVSQGSPLDYVSSNMQSSFFVNPVSSNEISCIIANLKKTGSNENTLPVTLLIHARDILCVPISNIINSSFSEGKFPDVLKVAEIVPIFKAGLPNSVSNYRPISLLPPLSKFFEKCMVTRLMKFLIRYKILSPVQFGFQSKKSTSDAVLKFVEYIYQSLNNKSHALSILVDYRKAFDTVNYKILLSKLHAYGIRGLPLEWFKNYLHNRKQYVRVGSSFSSTKPISIGIPQGSVAGPILFILYINDLPNVSELFSTILFADDTSLTVSDNQYDSLINKTNSELDKIRDWTMANRLSLNVDKTHAMLFTNRTHSTTDQEILFDGVPISRCNVVKFLGVTIDKSLKFDHHINVTCKKISKSIGILHKLKSYVPSELMVNLYYSLVYPYIIYCNIIWGGTYSSHLHPLFLLQKKNSTNYYK